MLNSSVIEKLDDIMGQKERNFWIRGVFDDVVLYIWLLFLLDIDSTW